VALFVANVLLRYELQLQPPAAGPRQGAAAAAAEPWWQRLLCPAAGQLADWKAALAPDAARYLPDIQHRRLVGVKWPAAPCVVRVAARD